MLAAGAKAAVNGESVCVAVVCGRTAWPLYLAVGFRLLARSVAVVFG